MKACKRCSKEFKPPRPGLRASLNSFCSKDCYRHFVFDLRVRKAFPSRDFNAYSATALAVERGIKGVHPGGVTARLGGSRNDYYRRKHYATGHRPGFLERAQKALDACFDGLEDKPLGER